VVREESGGRYLNPRSVTPARANTAEDAALSNERKSLSKRLRFEVFKRDKFTCQYCGQKAPDVVLECDHVHPVAEGGEDDLLNLVTACVGCNSGKGAVVLSDETAVKRQRAELDRLADRREQIEMLLEWSRGLAQTADAAIEAIVSRIHDCTGFFINEHGRANIRRWLKKQDLRRLLEAIETSASQYVRSNSEGRVTQESFELAFSKIPGIARISALPPEEKELYYIRGIARNRFEFIDQDLCIDLLRQAYQAGAEIAELKTLARRSKSWSRFKIELYELIGSADGHSK
jgi:5-methylcytosine-specific restriction endonuclease McrA